MQQWSGMACAGTEGVVSFASEAAEGASLINVIVDMKRDGISWRGGQEDK